MYNILDHILNTFTSRKYIIFFLLGKKYDFFPKKGFPYFLKAHIFANRKIYTPEKNRKKRVRQPW